MIQKLKNIFSVLVVAMLFLPSIIRLEHHHEYFDYPVKSGIFFHLVHEKCAVCNFEYSLFLSDNIKIALPNSELIDTYRICYTPCHYSGLSDYSFSLRAPPADSNNI